jgi:methyl-accepting chemotaxis protein
MSLRRKVLLVPLLGIAVLIGLGAYSFQFLQANRSAMVGLVNGPLRQTAAAYRLSETLWAAHCRLYRLAASAANENDPVKLKKLAGETIAAMSELEVRLNNLDLSNSAHAPSAVTQKKLKAEIDLYVKRAKDVADMAPTDAGTALMFMGPVEQSFVTVEASVHSITRMTDQIRNNEIATVLARQDQQMKLLILVTILSVVLGLSLSISVGRAIATPVSRVAETLKKMAAGDIDVTVPFTTLRNEIGAIAMAVESLKGGLLERRRLETEAGQIHQHNAEKLRATEDAFTEAGRHQSTVIKILSTALERLASGEIRVRIDEPVSAEFQNLKDDFNAATDKLRELIGAVATTSTEVRGSTEEIARAADDLARRTEQQAASLEETAAALDEINVMVRKTAEGTQHARSMVSAAKTNAEQGGAIVRQAIDAMSGIEKSSRQIAQIIGVIDEIAFQTNLLALNAGVEAARAGDAGRGFAVVASEVRALAQRSAEAAKEIKALISNATREVETGAEFVTASGAALEQIVAQVAEINGIVTQIAASTKDQAVGLGNVNETVVQMDQVTQQNAAMVEEATAASHALVEEMQRLNQLVGRFQLDEAGDPQAAETRTDKRRATGNGKVAQLPRRSSHG